MGSTHLGAACKGMHIGEAYQKEYPVADCLSQKCKPFAIKQMKTYLGDAHHVKGLDRHQRTQGQAAPCVLAMEPQEGMQAPAVRLCGCIAAMWRPWCRVQHCGMAAGLRAPPVLLLLLLFVVAIMAVHVGNQEVRQQPQGAANVATRCNRGGAGGSILQKPCVGGAVPYLFLTWALQQGCQDEHTSCMA